MNDANAALRALYLRDATETATPAERLLMTLDRLLVDLDQAASALRANDWHEANTRLVHAQDIFLALHGTLDTAAWPAGEQLKALYLQRHHELVAVNLRKDPERLEPVRSMAERVIDAWRSAATLDAALLEAAGEGAPGRPNAPGRVWTSRESRPGRTEGAEENDPTAPSAVTRVHRRRPALRISLERPSEAQPRRSSRPPTTPTAVTAHENPVLTGKLR